MTFDSSTYQGRRDGRILIVEDNAMNRKVLRILLERIGFEVDDSINGEACLQQLQQAQYCVALVDIDMPVMDGIEATRRIRRGDAGEENKSLPIILVSAKLEDEDPSLYQQLGVNAQVKKPYSALQLLTAVNQVLLPSAEET